MAKVSRVWARRWPQVRGRRSGWVSTARGRCWPWRPMMWASSVSCSVALPPARVRSTSASGLFAGPSVTRATTTSSLLEKYLYSVLLAHVQGARQRIHRQIRVLPRVQDDGRTFEDPLPDSSAVVPRPSPAPRRGGNPTAPGSICARAMVGAGDRPRGTAADGRGRRRPSLRYRRGQTLGAPWVGAGGQDAHAVVGGRSRGAGGSAGGGPWAWERSSRG